MGRPGTRPPGRPSPPRPLGVLLASLLGVGVTLALVLLLIVVFGRSDAQIAEAGPYPGDAAQWEPGAPETVSDGPSPVPTAPSPASSVDRTPSPPPAEASTPVPTSPVPAFRRVTVLNQTDRKGLAAEVGEVLSEQGWHLVSVGNFTGRVPSTTVYYPSGQEDAARALAADLPGPDRVAPVFSGLRTDRLTVVLTSDYPG